LKYFQIGAKTKGHAGKKHGPWANIFSRATEGWPPVKQVRADAIDLHMNLRHLSMCGAAAFAAARMLAAVSACGNVVPLVPDLLTFTST